MKQFRYTPWFFLASIFGSPWVSADDNDRFYATAIVGVGFLGSQNLNYRDGTIDSSVTGDFDASFNGGGTVGYRVNDQWRVEGELLYRRNDMNDVTLAGIGVSTEGDYASLTVGLSALYDFRPFDSDRLSAYVGAGIAFVQEIDIDFEVGGSEVSFETDEVGLQVQVGGRYALTDALYIDAGIRYMTLSDVKMLFPADTSRIVEADYAPLSATVGLGWRF